MDYKDIKETIISISDFPVKGISFKDITPLLLDHNKMEYVINEMSNFAKTLNFDMIAAPESRGFIFGMPLALKMKKPFIPVRKKGKLPREVESISYHLEYGTATLEVIKADIKPKSRILLVDDLVATGGTTIAMQQLFKKLDCVIVGQTYLIELVDLVDHEKLEGEFFSIVKF